MEGGVEGGVEGRELRTDGGQRQGSGEWWSVSGGREMKVVAEGRWGEARGRQGGGKRRTGTQVVR